MIYVCDHCGLYIVERRVPDDTEWTCADCGSHAAWEFPPERAAHAAAHSEHIRHGRRLFGETPRTAYTA